MNNFLNMEGNFRSTVDEDKEPNFFVETHFLKKIHILLLWIICEMSLFSLPQVACLLKNDNPGKPCSPSARPNVTAFAYFSSAVNPILYVFAGSSHIRQAGLSFMGRLFEATNSESRTTSTIARSGRSGSSPDESSVLYSLSTKIGKPFKGKGKERSSSLAGKEANEPALKTLATVEQLE